MRPVNAVGFAALLAALATWGCGAPSIDLPAGGETTSDNVNADGVGADLPAPTVTSVPGPYANHKVAVQGRAFNAARVVVDGAGNPAATAVQPVDGSFCVIVDLNVAPAIYYLDVRAQSSDGRLSAPSTITIDRVATGGLTPPVACTGATD